MHRFLVNIIVGISSDMYLGHINGYQQINLIDVIALVNIILEL